jgi:hypothetical protein
VPGDEYQFSFFLEGSNEVPNGSFQAYWNGVQVFDSSGLLSGDYEQYVFDVAAASSSTLIQFSGVNPPASYYLDDVQVDQLQFSSPEPASAVLAGLGLLICLARRSVFGGRWIGRKS